MDLRKLQIFHAVATLGSFSAAARQLHMAQPAASIAVRKLEEELELQLIDRGGARVSLSAEGRALLPRVQAILQQVDALHADSAELHGLLQGELALACPSMLASYFLPGLLGDFLSQHPRLRTAVTQAGTREIARWLLEGRVELGVVSLAADTPREALELLPLVEEQLVLCVASEHPWAGRRSLPLQALHGAPMVAYESGYYIRNRLDELCRAAGVVPELRLQSNFLPLLIRMVRHGLGATPGLRMLAEQEPGISAVPLQAEATFSMALARRSDRLLSRANQAFWDWLARRA